MLLAEEFVLLALDPDGTVVGGMRNQPVVAVGVVGVLISELVIGGHVDLTGGRVHVAGSVPAAPLLVQTLDALRPMEKRRLRSRLLPLAQRFGWRDVVDAMIADGRLGREKDLLVPTRHPITDLAAHRSLLAEVRRAATTDTPLDARLATFLALAGSCLLLKVVAPDRSDRAQAKRRIKEATALVSVAPAVDRVIDVMRQG